MNNSLGAVEFRSIAKGIEISNFMLKNSSVEIIYLKNICPGKYIILISGDTSEVENSINIATNLGSDYIMDSFNINNISNEILDGIKNKYKDIDIKDVSSIAVVETNRVCTGLLALDKILKLSTVSLLKLQFSFLIGGKLVFIIYGELSGLEYGIEECKKIIKHQNIVNISIIASVDKELIKKLI